MPLIYWNGNTVKKKRRICVVNFKSIFNNYRLIPRFFGVATSSQAR